MRDRGQKKQLAGVLFVHQGCCLPWAVSAIMKMKRAIEIRDKKGFINHSLVGRREQTDSAKDIALWHPLSYTLIPVLFVQLLLFLEVRCPFVLPELMQHDNRYVYSLCPHIHWMTGSGLNTISSKHAGQKRDNIYYQSGDGRYLE